MLYIGIDDTDTIETSGTGRLARKIAEQLEGRYRVHGIIRHQLLRDSRIPYTANNSSATIVLDEGQADIEGLFVQVRDMLLAQFQVGSDPGLAMAAKIADKVIAFGQRAKDSIVTQEEARALATDYGVRLEGLGGTNGGIIGALAAIGLAAGGEDGRYIQIGHIRELAGLQSVADVLGAGIDSIQTLEVEVITTGMVLADKLRPSRRKHCPVLYVERGLEGHWLPLKLD